MSEQARALLAQILALPEKERIVLLDAVDMSLGVPEELRVSTEEIGRRIDECRAGKAEVLDWAEARALIHRKRQ
jgi:hypothetical protein